jgi:hypothetical protein
MDHSGGSVTAQSIQRSAGKDGNPPHCIQVYLGVAFEHYVYIKSLTAERRSSLTLSLTNILPNTCQLGQSGTSLLNSVLLNNHATPEWIRHNYVFYVF